MNKRFLSIIVVILVSLPVPALANAGTPLMWASMIHLAVGNIAIGMLEAAILIKVFRLGKGKTTGTLIFANYFSAWGGGLFLSNVIAKNVNIDITNAWTFFWVMVLVTYLFTLILEFPFIAFCFRGDERWLSKTIRGSLLVQTVSYALIFSWYWTASGVTLVTQASVVSPASMTLPPNVMIYYISSDGDVYSMPLRGGGGQKVGRLGSSKKNDRLLLKPEQADKWQLLALLTGNDKKDEKLIKISSFPLSYSVPIATNPDHDRSQTEGTWFNFGEVPKLGEAATSAWKFYTGFWPVEGIRGENATTNKQVNIALETPYIAWNVRNAVHLPGDKVLFQLGDNQICIFDPEKKQIALIAKGRGPIAVANDLSPTSGGSGLR